MDEFDDKDWGIRINKKSYTKFDLDAPVWAKDNPTLAWYSEGLVVWDVNEKTVVNLNMWHVMDLLDRLGKDETWKTAGQDLLQKYTDITIPLGRRGRKKTPEEKEPSQSKDVTIRLHLNPEQTKKLLLFLNKHESYVRIEGSIIKRRYEEGMRTLVDMLLEGYRKQQEEKEPLPTPDPYDFLI